jgi:hypothetical protein
MGENFLRFVAQLLLNSIVGDAPCVEEELSLSC